MTATFHRYRCLTRHDFCTAALLLTGSLATAFVLTAMPANALDKLAPPSSAPASLNSRPITAPAGYVFRPLDVGLTVEASSQITLSDPNYAHRDFGEIDPFTTQQAEQTFVLQNSGKTSLTLTDMKATCGCTSVFFGTAASVSQALPVLAPGQKTTVRMRVDFTNLSPASLHKYVLIYAQGYEIPVGVLEMTGTLLPSARIAPEILDFGAVAGGKMRSLEITVTYAKQALSANGLPPLLCSDPTVQVKPISGAHITNAAFRQDKQDKNVGTQKYQIMLPADAPAGPVAATLSFTASGQAGAIDASSAEAIVPGLRNVAAYLKGQITGEVAASPSIASLVRVVPGQQVSQTIALTGKTAASLQDIQITSASPYMALRLQSPRIQSNAPANAAQTAVAARTRTLVISLAANTPPGILQTSVLLTLANGKLLRIPVNVYVIGQGAEK